MEPLPADGLTAGAALAIAPGVFVDIADPVRPGDAIMLVEPGEDGLLLGIDVLATNDGETGVVGAVCGKSSEIPVLPSIDPVWTLAMGLHGVGVVLVGGI